MRENELRFVFYCLTGMIIYVTLMIVERSAHGQSDSNLEHKGQAVADTRTKSDNNLGRKGQAVADTRINRL